MGGLGYKMMRYLHTVYRFSLLRSLRNEMPLFSFSVLTCLFSLLCALAVTLLDSMSALADLGWEAYPNEGVSIV